MLAADPPERSGGLTPAERLTFSIAERLGMTVGELLERMSAAELMTWMSLPRIDSELERARNLNRMRELWRT